MTNSGKTDNEERIAGTDFTVRKLPPPLVSRLQYDKDVTGAQTSLGL